MATRDRPTKPPGEAPEPDTASAPTSEPEATDDRGTARDPDHSAFRMAGAEQTGHRATHLPEGTATDVPAMEGTSVDAPAVQGMYRPDVGPGGEDIDEGDSVLPNRSRVARGPEHPAEPSPKQRPLSPGERSALRR